MVCGEAGNREDMMERGKVFFWKWNFPMNPHVRWLFCQLVGWSVCMHFLKGREVTLPCSCRTTCLLKACDEITDQYKNLMKSDCIPVTMGGDHLITYPILRFVRTNWFKQIKTIASCLKYYSPLMICCFFAGGHQLRREAEVEVCFQGHHWEAWTSLGYPCWCSFRNKMILKLLEVWLHYGRVWVIS